MASDKASIVGDAEIKMKLQERLKISLEKLNIVRNELAELVKHNKEFFIAYLDRHARLRRQWLPIERELILEPLIYGNLGQVNSKIINFNYTYEMYVEEFFMHKVGDLARRPDFEAAPIQTFAIPKVNNSQNEQTPNNLMHAIIENDLLRDKKYTNHPTTKVVCSRKTKAFVEMEIPETIDGCDIALYYTLIYGRIFREQIAQLPHLTALFYNDCMVISLMCITKFKSKGEPGVQVEKKRANQIANLGIQSLKCMINKIKVDIESVLLNRSHNGLAGESWNSTRFGQLQPDTCELLSNFCAKSLARVAQIDRILKPILSEFMLRRLLGKCLLIVATWAWNGITEQRGSFVDRECVVSKILLPILRAIKSYLHFREFVGLESISTKLELATRIGSMSLIQVSNAFRREEFVNLVSPLEFSQLVNSFFTDSPMKRAFMDEVAADF